MAHSTMPMKRRLVIAAAILGLTVAPAMVMLVVTWLATGAPLGAATLLSCGLRRGEVEGWKESEMIIFLRGDQHQGSRD